jgi:hypothetical protein
VNLVIGSSGNWIIGLADWPPLIQLPDDPITR